MRTKQEILDVIEHFKTATPEVRESLIIYVARLAYEDDGSSQEITELIRHARKVFNIGDENV